MKIFSINYNNFKTGYSNQNYNNPVVQRKNLSPVLDCFIKSSVNFGAKPVYIPFQRDHFYIKIKGYGKNKDWANKIIETTVNAVKEIKDNNATFDSVMKNIALGVHNAHQTQEILFKDGRLFAYAGFLRTKRAGFKNAYQVDLNTFLTTPYGSSSHCKYKSYEDRIDYVLFNPLKNPYPDEISLTRPISAKNKKSLNKKLSKYDFEHPATFLETFLYKMFNWVNPKNQNKILVHGDAKKLPTTFSLLEKMFSEFRTNYVLNPSGEKDINKITEEIAKMRWILAHATPFERGSDSIGNVFMRAMYDAAGVKTYPPAEGISYDLEAFCTEMPAYVKKFPKLFEKPPEYYITNKKTRNF